MPSPKELKRQHARAKNVRREQFKRARNASVRSTVRRLVRRARTAIDEGDAAAGEAVRAAQSALDSAARRGIIPRNAAARRLGRLVKRQRAAEEAA